MDHKDNDSCKFCDLVKKVWGDKYTKCSEVITHFSILLLKAFNDEGERFLDVLDKKKDEGIVDYDTHKLMFAFLQDSMIYSAAEFPACVVSSGYSRDTMDMMLLCNETLMMLVRNGIGVSAGTQEAFTKLMDGFGQSVEKVLSESIKNNELQDLPQINVASPKKSSPN